MELIQGLAKTKINYSKNNQSLLPLLGDTVLFLILVVVINSLSLRGPFSLIHPDIGPVNTYEGYTGRTSDHICTYF